MSNFIEIYEGALHPPMCDDIIALIEANLPDDFVWRSRKNSPSGGSPGHKIKDKSLSLDVHFSDLAKQLQSDVLVPCLEQYVSKYPGSDHTYSNYHFKYQRTEPGEGYHIWHCENSHPTTVTRELVWTIYLNDVDEGGETEFLHQSLRIQPKKGSVMIFPSAWTHMHRGNPPLKGTKHIITGWFFREF